MLTLVSFRLPSRRLFISALVALAIPLCLAAGSSTAAIAAAETCQPQAVRPDFCTKVTHQSDVAAVVPNPGVPLGGGGLTPHVLYTDDTFTHPLPGYLTTPSGRSPPRV